MFVISEGTMLGSTEGLCRRLLGRQITGLRRTSFPSCPRVDIGFAFAQFLAFDRRLHQIGTLWWVVPSRFGCHLMSPSVTRI